MPSILRTWPRIADNIGAHRSLRLDVIEHFVESWLVERWANFLPNGQPQRVYDDNKKGRRAVRLGDTACMGPVLQSCGFGLAVAQIALQFFDLGLAPRAW